MVDSPLVYRGERIKKVNDRKERILGSDGGEVDREAKRRRGRSLAFRACVRDEVGWKNGRRDARLAVGREHRGVVRAQQVDPQQHPFVPQLVTFFPFPSLLPNFTCPSALVSFRVLRLETNSFSRVTVNPVSSNRPATVFIRPFFFLSPLFFSFPFLSFLLFFFFLSFFFSVTRSKIRP